MKIKGSSTSQLVLLGNVDVQLEGPQQRLALCLREGLFALPPCRRLASGHPWRRALGHQRRSPVPAAVSLTPPLPLLQAPA